jgi:phosphatidylserine decarboxylase precursor
MKPWLATIEKLKIILDTRPDLRSALEAAIQKAAVPGIKDLSQYYQFLIDLLTRIPTQRDMDPATINFHYIVNSSPDNILLKDDTFQQWLVTFSKDHGSFLDTPDSAQALDTFISDPEYRIDDYYVGPSGWITFNQFFARRVRPGKRPIAEPCDDSVVVSPTDSIYLGRWNIDDQTRLNIKGTSWSITELLANSQYKDGFANGVFTHCYLQPTDYHHFHLPVAGTVLEARTIPGRVTVEMEIKENKQPTAKDEIGFQFRQTRGIVILDSPLGYVAVIPVGMGHVSSVNLIVSPGDRLTKGQDFGYFCYGGSDIILLFQQNKVKFTAQPGKHYLQGAAIAVAASMPAGPGPAAP